MNSRSGVNESSLVNFSTDLPSLDAKDSLLSFPFDHLYACHSDSPDLNVDSVIGDDKRLVIADPEVEQLNDRLTASENQNKRLKDLLIYHLDLIQQQNDLITKRDKLYQALRLENENLKNKLNRRHGLNLPPPPPLPPPVLLPPPPPPAALAPPASLAPPKPLAPPAPLGPPASRISIAPLRPPPSRVSIAPLAPPAPLAPSALLASPAPPKPLAPSASLAPPATPAPPTLKAELSATSSAIKQETSPVMLNSFTELFMPESRSSTYLFDGKLGQPSSFEKETFGIARTTIPMDTDATTYGADSKASPAETSRLRYPRCERFKPIESKRSYTKKEPAKPDHRSEALYTVTSNSGNPVIQRVQRNRKRNSTGVGHLSRMTKTSPKLEPFAEASKIAEDLKYDPFGINKKNKMLNTYGKSKVTATCTATSTTSTITKCSMFGSLSDRFQLIDKTPTGEDPYQLGEADLREQSPIPKLMLQKSNHGRLRVQNNQPSRRIYDPDSPEPKIPRRANRFLSSTFTADLKKEAQTLMVQEPDMDVIKTEPEIEWRAYSPKFKTSIEICAASSLTPPLSDITSGEIPSCIATNTLYVDNTLECDKFEGLFPSDEVEDLDELNDSSNVENSQDETKQDETEKDETEKDETEKDETEKDETEKDETEKDETEQDETEQDETLKIEPNDTLETIEEMVNMDVIFNESYGLLPTLEDLNVPLDFPPNLPLEEEEEEEEVIPVKETKRGRKRALSTTGLGRGGKGAKAPAKSRRRGRATRSKRSSPPPATLTTEEYHTAAGDFDQSWYFGLDSAVKLEDLESYTEQKTDNVEVPRWREKPYTSTYTLEGTENIEDRVFEKRHQKLEAEERRQLRWHMRRIREQRHVEKLRQRQRDSWCTTVTVPSVYTVWPRPHRDLRFIEITESLPVMAFGEVLPDLPKADFMLPWVRTSKALKRSKRSKTLH